jgi:hypothetical protein
VFVAGRLLGVAVSLAGMLAASGCGDAGSTGPRSLPPATATPVGAAASGSPSYDEDAALAAATAVVRQYFALKNQLTREATADQLAALISDACPCQELVEAARELEAKGGTFFGRAQVTALTPAIDDANTVEVLVRYDASAGGTKNSLGEVLYRGNPHEAVEQLFLIHRQAGRWLVTDIKLVDPGR